MPRPRPGRADPGTTVTGGARSTPPLDAESLPALGLELVVGWKRIGQRLPALTHARCSVARTGDERPRSAALNGGRRPCRPDSWPAPCRTTGDRTCPHAVGARLIQGRRTASRRAMRRRSSPACVRICATAGVRRLAAVRRRGGRLARPSAHRRGSGRRVVDTVDTGAWERDEAWRRGWKALGIRYAVSAGRHGKWIAPMASGGTRADLLALEPGERWSPSPSARSRRPRLRRRGLRSRSCKRTARSRSPSPSARSRRPRKSLRRRGPRSRSCRRSSGCRPPRPRTRRRPPCHLHRHRPRLPIQARPSRTRSPRGSRPGTTSPSMR